LESCDFGTDRGRKSAINQAVAKCRAEDRACTKQFAKTETVIKKAEDQED